MAMAIVSLALVGLPAFSSAQVTPETAAPNVAVPQTVLTLKEAVRLAALRNATLRAQAAAARGATASLDAAFAAFFPSLSPVVRYEKSNIYTNGGSQSGNNGSGSGNQLTSGDGWQVGLEATIKLLDSGQRNLTFMRTKRNAESEFANLTQTLRSTLFNVERAYLEVLRAQELQKVKDAQVVRTDTILKQTEKRVEVGDAARKDNLQARADALNAQVDVITARTRTISNQASLKALIGLGATEGLPPLESVGTEIPADSFGSVEQAVQEGLKNRPNLLAQRLGVQAQEFQAKAAKLDTGLTFSADATINAFDRPRYGGDSLNFTLSFPLFDGGLTRANYRVALANLDQARQNLIQSERDATSEIESTYASYQQGTLRLAAATAAVEAARINYQAAERSNQLGASDLIDVLTAQVSLVTAETNYIEALYETLIAYRQLELSTCRKLGLEQP
jgi:outer membrane protein